MKIRYFLPIMVMLIGTAFSQYLTYSELIGLLNIAHDDVKVDEFLVKRGFEYGSGDIKEGIKSYSYGKYIGKDHYAVGVAYDGELNSTRYGYTSVSESSDNVARWNYFKQIVSGYGYKQMKAETEENGDLRILYKNNEFKIIMKRGKIDFENRYYTLITKL